MSLWTLVSFDWLLNWTQLHSQQPDAEAGQDNELLGRFQ